MSASSLTVVIPVYNRAAEIRECLAPFTGPDATGVQVIVVDDGSSDQSAEAAEAVAATSQGAIIRVIRQANAGPGAARNNGVGHADTEWVAFHDSDDRWMPWTLSLLRDRLAEAQAASVLFLATRNFTDPAEIGGWQGGEPALRRHPTMLDMRLNDPLPMVASCNVVFRRTAFLALGGFTTEVRHNEDTDLFYRAGEMGEVWVMVAPVLVAYATGTGGSLTDTGDRSRRTLYLLRRNRDGVYPGPAAKRNRALGRTVAYTIRGYFAKGYVKAAYRLYFNSMSTLFAARDWNALTRLPLTPVLSLVRPANYRFRWKP